VTRAVFDTNTLAFGAVAIAGPVAVLIDAWQHGYVEVILSSHILSELETALSKPYFMSRLDTQSRAAFLTLARTTTTVVAITAAVPNVALTRADNLVLATADSGGASFLVTGDRELQRLERYKSVAILSPRQFLDLLNLETSRTR
jgi:putative PIN family toxin of toxin-antitoxin system